MTNVDLSLITGHDFRNYNVPLLRMIGGDYKATPHPQLLKLFEHYKYMLRNDGPRDEVLLRASLFWVYQTFIEQYGEDIICRERIDHNQYSPIFFKEYLLKIDPLIISLSFSEIVFLFFGIEDYDLAKRIIKRLSYLSSVWTEFCSEESTGNVLRLPAYKHPAKEITSHWNNLTGNPFYPTPRIPLIDPRSFLPEKLVVCLKDVWSAYNIFKNNGRIYARDGSEIDLFIKICLGSDRSLKQLLNIIQKIEVLSFDPVFIFSGLRWKCTRQEFVDALPRTVDNINPIAWMILCYLHKIGSFNIDFDKEANLKIKHINRSRWSPNEPEAYKTMFLGCAMFDYHVFDNKETILTFLENIQYKRYRKSWNDGLTKSLIKTAKRYRELNLTLDPKELKIKRGVLINILSAGLGDIFCCPPTR